MLYVISTFCYCKYFTRFPVFKCNFVANDDSQFKQLHEIIRTFQSLIEKKLVDLII